MYFTLNLDMINKYVPVYSILKKNHTMKAIFQFLVNSLWWHCNAKSSDVYSESFDVYSESSDVCSRSVFVNDPNKLAPGAFCLGCWYGHLVIVQTRFPVMTAPWNLHICRTLSRISVKFTGLQISAKWASWVRYSLCDFTVWVVK